MVAAAQRLGVDDSQVVRLGRLAAAVKTGKADPVHAFAKRPRRYLRDLETAEPRRLADERAEGRPEAVLIGAADIRLLVETLLGAGTPRYATGADLYQRMARSGPPAQIMRDSAQRPHRVGDCKSAREP